MIKSPQYILWLPSWYPNEITPYDGDFVQRHARAVAAFAPVCVFHIIRDKKKKMTRSVRVHEKKGENLTETIIYYASPDIPWAFADRFLSQVRYAWIYRKYIRKLFREKGFPELVHVHIIYKAGLIARWIEKKFGIPFLLTEQWTIHLPEARPSLFDLSFAEQMLFSKIMDHVSLVLPVSKYLGKAMKQHWPHINFEVVPNVVDHQLFFPAEKKGEDRVLRLIHISTLQYQKDPESLFAALGKLKEQGIDFTLDLIGPVTAEISEYIRQTGIQDLVRIQGEMPQQRLSKLLQQTDALVLYSRYETFGCVIIEANACGIPVIVPDTKLMEELVVPGLNGIKVKPNDPSALAAAIIAFHANKASFNRQQIADTTEKYSFKNVGSMFFEIYNRYISD
ncbi:MAG: glycosyltransferase [Terrimonas sp.]|nr:glycosyltransferase [Terrimonas sp.]